MDFAPIVEAASGAVDLAGVVTIVGGIVVVTLLILPRLRETRPNVVYRDYRRAVGKVVLLGLELLVAADIIRTVAVAPTLEGVAVLALIVLVRTFLSFSLEVELYGQWPWQRHGEDNRRGEAA